MKPIKILFILLVISFGFLLFLSLKSIPIGDENSLLVKRGVVTEVYAGDSNDVILRLTNTERLYYINRGRENGIELNQLNEKIVGKEVTIKYPDYWTPLDPNHSIKHIAKLELNEEVIYSEVD